MSTRTFEELNEAVKAAVAVRDAEALVQCAAELETLQVRDAIALSANAQGIADVIHGNNSGALEHYHRALTIYEELGEGGGVATVTSNIGNVHFKNGNYTEALEHYQRTLASREKLGDLNGMARVTGNIGFVHQNSGNYPSALEYLHRALTMYEELRDLSGAAHIMSKISNVHRSTGNYPASLEYHYRTLTMYEDLGDRKGEASVIGNLGNVHWNNGNYPAALEHYHRALAMHEEIGNRNGVAAVTANMGGLHLSTGNYAAALEHYRAALAMSEELDDRIEIARTTGNITQTLTRTGEFAEAQALLHKMDAMQIDEADLVVLREQCRAAIHQNAGNFEEAFTTLRTALEIASERSLVADQAEIHKALRDLCQKNNDFAGYIEHNNEYTRITEEINGKEATLKMAMQEKQREIDAREREHQKHLAVLHSTLPKHIADRVARGEVVNDHFDNVSVIFLDLVGFTGLSSSLDPRQVATVLQSVFDCCDEACTSNYVTRIKTIGDAYLAVSFPNN